MKVAVFSGQVELRPKKSATTNLAQGDAALFRRSSAPERLQSVTLTQTQGASRLDFTKDAQPLIGGVSDNLGATTRRFYGVVPGAMKANVHAFVDRAAPVWKALPGQAFPAELEGADLIQTFQDLRWGTDLRLTLTVNRPAIIYLLHDPRNPAPDWLKRDFIDTGLRLRSGSWTAANVTQGLTPEANGRFHIPVAVWKREVAKPGTVELGPPYPADATVPSAMYGIAVKTLPQ